jgi:hypothetical protein
MLLPTGIAMLDAASATEGYALRDSDAVGRLSEARNADAKTWRNDRARTRFILSVAYVWRLRFNWWPKLGFFWKTCKVFRLSV